MKAVICGAGIAGLALARLLSVAGWEVVLVERAEELRGQGYMIDFFGPGYDAAEAMGLLPRLRELAFDVDEISSVSHRGRRVAGLDYRAYARALGGRLLSLMRGDLEGVLYESLDDRVELLFGHTVTAVEQSPDAVTVILADGDRTALICWSALMASTRRCADWSSARSRTTCVTWAFTPPPTFSPIPNCTGGWLTSSS